MANHRWTESESIVQLPDGEKLEEEINSHLYRSPFFCYGFYGHGPHPFGELHYPYGHGFEPPGGFHGGGFHGLGAPGRGRP